jgi:hypothetical protein
MARKLVCLAAFLILTGGCIIIDRTSSSPQEAPAPAVARQQGEEGKPEQLLRHVVLLRFKEGVGAEEITRVENARKALPRRNRVIHGVEWGAGVRVERQQPGFTHCFVLSFVSESDRAAYLLGPNHAAFVKMLEPYLDSVLIVDYQVE